MKREVVLSWGVYLSMTSCAVAGFISVLLGHTEVAFIAYGLMFVVGLLVVAPYLRAGRRD